MFVAALAMVAFAAVSCKPKGEAPKAAFSYEFEDLKVTFTDASKNAETYAWDFGDGAKSTEKNPVHEYANNGTYTVTLTVTNAYGNASASEELIMSAPLVTVDGKFDDWDKLITNSYGGLTKFENDPAVEWDTYGLTKIYYAVDANFLYFFMYYKDGAEESEKNNSFAFYIDADGDPTTGKDRSGYWANIGAEYLVEFGDGDATGWDNWTVFNVWIYPEGENVGTYSDQPVVKGEIGSAQVVEGAVALPYFAGHGDLNSSSVIGCRSCEPGWSKVGGLPAIYIIEGESVTQDAPALKFPVL